MIENLEQRLRTVLSDLPPENVHAVAAFADFLTQQRHTRRANRRVQLAERAACRHRRRPRRSGRHNDGTGPARQ